MLHLVTFGGLGLRNGSIPVEGATAQRRRLLLLAVLASEYPAAVSRQTLGELLWSEQADTAARRANVRQAVFALRHGLTTLLGQSGSAVSAALDPIVGSAGMTLNPAVVDADCVRFQDSVDAERYSDAIRLYRGPFLAGVTLTESPVFGAWLAARRSRWAAQFRRVCTVEATRAGAEGRWDAALEASLALRTHDPDEPRAIHGIVTALVHLGRNDEAREQAQHYDQARARIDVQHASGARVLESASATLDRVLRERRSDSSDRSDRALPAASDPDCDARHRAGQHRRGHLVGVLVLVTLGLVTLGIGAFRHIVMDSAGNILEKAVPANVAVLPFRVHGDANEQYLCEGMVDLLSVGLDLPGEVRTVDPRAVLRSEGASACDGGRLPTPDAALARAKQLGATAAVLGDLVAAGGKVRIVARLYDVAHGEHVLASAQAESDSATVFQAVDNLSEQLLGALDPGPHGELAQLATVTTSSLPALKAYLDGEAAYRRRYYPQAVAYFQRSVALDTSFALAQYRLALAADWAGLYPLPLTAAEAAYRHRARLAPRVRLLLTGFRAWRVGGVDSAEAAYRAALARGISDPDAWYQLGEVLYHDSGLRARSPQEARGPFERAVALDPMNDAALAHLYRLAAQRGDRVAVDSLARRLLVTAQGSRAHDEIIAFRAAVHGDTVIERQALSRLVSLEDPTLYDLAEYFEVYAHDLGGAEWFIRRLLPERNDVPWRFRGLSELAIVELAQGRWRDARAALAAASAVKPGAATELRAYVAGMPDLPIPTGDIRAARTALESLSPASSGLALRRELQEPIRAHLLGLVDVRLGDTAAARAVAERLEQVHGDSLVERVARAYANGIRAAVDVQSGDARDALPLLGRSHPQLWLEELASIYGGAVPERLLTADLLRARGDVQAALAWYTTLPASRGHELIALGPALLGQAAVDERMGRAHDAAAAYDRLIRLWDGGDPEFRAVVRDAQARRAHVVLDEGSR